MSILFLNCIVKNYKKKYNKSILIKILFSIILYTILIARKLIKIVPQIYLPNSRTIFHVKKSSLIKIDTNSASKNQNNFSKNLLFFSKVSLGK